MKIVTAAEMTALEQSAERRGVSTNTLMENAGLAVAEVSRDLMGCAAGKRVLVLVGPGNNGADGLVTGRHLARWGAGVTAYVVRGRPDPDPKMELALGYGLTVTDAANDPDLAALDRLLSRSDLVVDAILGTGRSRPLTGIVGDVIAQLNRHSRESGNPPALNSIARDSIRPTIVAMDLPTGLNCDTGEVDPACPQVDVTVALGRPKVGLLTFPGAERAGRLEVAGIGLPPDLPEEQGIFLELLTPEWVRERLPERPANSHKGTFGHALVVAGSRNYVGAAYLASQASVRTGAGLTTLASARNVYPIAAGKLTEVIHLPLSEDGAGMIHSEAARLLRPNLSRYSTLLIGCGLGWSPGTERLLEALVLGDPPLPMPVVVDADGLNSLSGIADWHGRLPSPAVLTPHPGEMATLTGMSTAEVQRDRVGIAREWSQRWNATVVLKGAHTVIADPGGLVRVAPFANPGMASAGTGDVLSGIITGLLAQGLGTTDAACCGVYMHGLASEAVTRKLGNAGSLASDLVEQIPDAIRRLKQ